MPKGQKIDHDELLKNSVIDANKLVETATEYAKDLIEEAITPQIKSMLTRKLKTEVEDDLDDEIPVPGDEMPDEFTVEEPPVDIAPEVEPDVAPAPAPEMEPEPDVAPAPAPEMEPEPEAAPAPEMEPEPAPEMEPEPEYSEEDDDLEEEINAILRELEEEENLHETEEPVEEAEKPEVDEKPAVSEAEKEEITEEEIDEILKQLREDDSEDAPVSESDEDLDEVTKQRNEAYETIQKLQSTINEMNILNAKLLYTNRLFKAFDLSEKQRMKIVETIDKADTIREAKLVYVTMLNSLNESNRRRTNIKENYASSVTANKETKKNKIISEGGNVVSRFQKLAGIITENK